MPNNDEVLAFARYQRAVNLVAIAMIEGEQALLTGRDADVDEAQAKLERASDALSRASARAIMEQVARLRAGHTSTAPGALEYDADDDFDQAAQADGVAEEVSEPSGPPIQHRILQGSASDIALCGAPMSASTPNAPDCTECNRVLEARLGMITHRSPSFGA